MRILLVDDEAPARERLRRLISEMQGDYQVCGEAEDGVGALEGCKRLEADLVLLDIGMPGMSGLEAARRLAGLDPPPAVILVTAYPEHALEAFEHRVEDYLVKPVRPERLQSALERVCVSTRPQRNALLQSGSGRTRRSRLSAHFRGALHSVPIDEVIYLQAEQKYVALRYPGGQLLLDESLRSLEEELGETFVRIHRNALVALRSIAGLERDADGSTRVRLRGCTERLTVSRRHLPELRQLLRSGSKG